MPATYGFEEADVRRINAAVRAHEQPAGSPAARMAPPRLLLPTRNAVVTATISARSATTKGSGTVTLYVDDGTGTGAMAVLQAGVTAWNCYAAAIAPGKWVVVGIVDGLLQVLGGDC